MRSRAVVGGLLALVALVGLLVGLNRANGPALPVDVQVTHPASTVPPPGRDHGTGLLLVELASLPREAQRTVARIEAGGPFPYAKDGAVFGNRERVLPSRSTGFYREYTVVTPGEGDRGARRIVTGDQEREFFYTDDHYASFVRIRR